MPTISERNCLRNGRARVVEYGEVFEEDVPQQPVVEEVQDEAVAERVETPAPRSRRAGALVLGTGLVMYFLLRQ